MQEKITSLLNNATAYVLSNIEYIIILNILGIAHPKEISLWWTKMCEVGFPLPVPKENSDFAHFSLSPSFL